LEVGANLANASIKSVKAGPSCMEAAAAKNTRGAAQGIGSMNGATRSALT
jgi:hypothetical protein